MVTKRKDYLLKASATAIVVALLTLYIISFHEGENRYYRLYYFVPASIPATLFVFDRLTRFGQLGGLILGIDTMVSTVSLIRVKYPIPFYSGHALFLTYFLLTTRDRLCLVTTAIVLVQTTYLKVVVWDNDVTLYGGIILGCLANVVHKHYLKKDLLRREG